MARGDRREPIVLDDTDREMFVRTLGELCAKTGWEVFAWVLMYNHYHLAVRTPDANLVEGMTSGNTWTGSRSQQKGSESAKGVSQHFLTGNRQPAN